MAEKNPKSTVYLEGWHDGELGRGRQLYPPDERVGHLGWVAAGARPETGGITARAQHVGMPKGSDPWTKATGWRVSLLDRQGREAYDISFDRAAPYAQGGGPYAPFEQLVANLEEHVGGPVSLVVDHPGPAASFYEANNVPKPQIPPEL